MDIIQQGYEWLKEFEKHCSNLPGKLTADLGSKEKPGFVKIRLPRPRRPPNTYCAVRARDGVSSACPEGQVLVHYVFLKPAWDRLDRLFLKRDDINRAVLRRLVGADIRDGKPQWPPHAGRKERTEKSVHMHLSDLDITKRKEWRAQHVLTASVAKALLEVFVSELERLQ